VVSWLPFPWVASKLTILWLTLFNLQAIFIITTKITILDYCRMSNTFNLSWKKTLKKSVTLEPWWWLDRKIQGNSRELRKWYQYSISVRLVYLRRCARWSDSEIATTNQISWRKTFEVAWDQSQRTELTSPFYASERTEIFCREY